MPSASPSRIAVCLATPTSRPRSARRFPSGRSRIEVARAALTNPKIDFFPRLAAASGPLDVYTFGVQRNGRSWVDTTWLKDVKAEEPRTALVDAAFDLINRDDTDAPGALVLVTDGRENASAKSLTDLARECARRKIPIHVYGVGSSSYGQLRLRDVVVPEVLFVDDFVSIPVRYSVRGIPEGKVDIVLTYAGREVAAKRDIPVKQGDDLKEVLTFVPQKSDAAVKRQELTATITVTSAGGIQTETLSDSITKPSQVVDKKLKVLVVDSLPRYDFKFLQRALLRDRRVEAKFYLTEGDKQAMRSGPPWLAEFSHELNGTLNLDRNEFRKLLFEFDLIILGRRARSASSPASSSRSSRSSSPRGAGSSRSPAAGTAPAGWADDKNIRAGGSKPNRRSPAGRVRGGPLPDPGAEHAAGFRAGPGAGRGAKPALLARRRPDRQRRTLGQSPAPQAEAAERQATQAAVLVLPGEEDQAGRGRLPHAPHRAPTPDNKPMPLLVGHYFGKGYVLFVGFDDTWRWRFNTQEKLFGRFWSQAVYTAGIPRIVGTKLTQLSLDATDPMNGKSGQIYARVFNENFQLLTAAGDRGDAGTGRCRPERQGPDHDDHVHARCRGRTANTSRPSRSTRSAGSS